MKITVNDVGTVMKYSRYKTLGSFQTTSIRPMKAGLVSMQPLDNVAGTLTARGSVESVWNVESVARRAVKPFAK